MKANYSKVKSCCYPSPRDAKSCELDQPFHFSQFCHLVFYHFCRFFSVLTSGVLSLLFELGSARFNDILSVLFGLHGSESSSLVVLSTWRDFKILPSHFGDFYFAENILVYGIGKGCVNLTLSRSNCVNEHFSANIDFLKCRLIVFEWKNGHSGLGKQETYP